MENDSEGMSRRGRKGRRKGRRYASGLKPLNQKMLATPLGRAMDDRIMRCGTIGS